MKKLTLSIFLILITVFIANGQGVSSKSVYSMGPNSYINESGSVVDVVCCSGSIYIYAYYGGASTSGFVEVNIGGDGDVVRGYATSSNPSFSKSYSYDNVGGYYNSGGATYNIIIKDEGEGGFAIDW